MSSAAFYGIQGVYSSYVLYRLLAKNERSKSLIAAVIMMLYSSFALAVYFALGNYDFFNPDVWSWSEKVYFIFVNELSNLCVYLAHWIILYQYLELALVLPILSKIAEFSADAHNKMVSIRQCLTATMIIVVAIRIAHFADKAFYTLKESSDGADNSVRYVALALKLGIMIMSGFIFIKLYYVIKKEPLLQLNERIFRTHVVALCLFYICWVAYEVSVNVFEFDDDYQEGKSDVKLTLLAVITLLLNTASVFLCVLLFYMVDKMTLPV